MIVLKRDLVAIFLWAIVTLLMVLLTDSVVIRVLLAAPLVLVFTGHAVLRAIGFVVPSLIEHVVYAIGASIAVCVISGFVLNVFSLLTPTGWAIWFAMVTGAAARIARYDEVTFPVVHLPHWQRGHVVVLGCAALITGGAYLLALHDEANQREFIYTDFWMLPKPGKLLIGVKSAELAPQRFDVEVTSKDHVIARWNAILVVPGHIWTKTVDLSPRSGYKTEPSPSGSSVSDKTDSGKIEAKLYRSSDHAIYRNVSAIIPGD